MLPARQKTSMIILGYLPLLALLGLVIVFWLLEPRFLSGFNVYSVAARLAIPAMLAFGLTLSVASGEYDISLGTNLTFCSVVFMGLLGNQVHPALAIIVTLIFGVVLAVIKWLLICKFGIHSIIATLAVAVVLDGASLLYTGGYRLYRGLTPAVRFLGGGRVAFFPVISMIALSLGFLLWLFHSRTGWGWRLSAVGQDARTAELLGVSASKYKLCGLLMCSLMAAFAGVLYAARTGTAEPYSQFGFTIDAFVAAMIGYVVRLEGRAHILGTLNGVLILVVLENGLVVVGAPFFVQKILKGLLILLAILVSSRLGRRRKSVG